MSGDNGPRPRQRLLYIHAQTPNILSPVLEMTIYEPVPGFKMELTADDPEYPYATVHEAVVDGWQVVQFPLHQAEYDDDEIDMVGYQFILQKMEVVDG